jgi:hypothetical protein
VLGVTFLSVVGVVGAGRSVVVVVGSVVVVVAALVVVVGFVAGAVVTPCAAFAAYPTKSAEDAHDPKKIAWVT